MPKNIKNSSETIYELQNKITAKQQQSQDRFYQLQTILADLLSYYSTNYWELSHQERWSTIQAFGDYAVEYGRLSKRVTIV
jgi:hypothetical protein